MWSIDWPFTSSSAGQDCQRNELILVGMFKPNRSHSLIMEISKKDLTGYDGKNGNPAYVGYMGKVYDVSSSPIWIDGEHQFSHNAGQDLTEAMADAPHADEVFETFSVVGTLID